MNPFSIGRFRKAAVRNAGIFAAYFERTVLDFQPNSKPIQASFTGLFAGAVINAGFLY